jgi:hypothetical protein
VNKYSLHEVELSSCDGIMHRAAAFNPFGFVTGWTGQDGVGAVLASKRAILFGGLALRAFTLRPFFSSDRRAEMFGTTDPPSYGAFLMRWMQMAVFGVPLEEIDSPVSLFPGGEEYTLTLRSPGGSA